MTGNGSTHLEAARRIGTRLARDAIWHEHRCNWYAPFAESLTGAPEEGICTLGPTLYDGTAGIGLFLATLGRLTDDPVIAATGRGAIEHALSRLDDVLPPMRQGFYTGAVGIGYAAVKAGQACGDDNLARQGLEVILDIVGSPAPDALTDVISGMAGTIQALIALFAEGHDRQMLAAARQTGEVILERSVACPRGLSWDTMGEMARALESAGMAGLVANAGMPHLTGLSHGAGGIALALLELGAATDDRRFDQAARRAFAYEDSWFDEAHFSWPDLRHSEAHSGTVSAWCHGASGIGLARLRAFEVTREEPFRADTVKCLQIAGQVIGSRLAEGQANYSLCHGVAGDAELFLRAAGTLGLSQARTVADSVAEYGVITFADTGAPWPSGAPGRAEVPGLMLGLAGTGYFFLRMSDPQRVPSILVLG